MEKARESVRALVCGPGPGGGQEMRSVCKEFACPAVDIWVLAALENEGKGGRVEGWQDSVRSLEKKTTWASDSREWVGDGQAELISQAARFDGLVELCADSNVGVGRRI